MLKAKDEVKIKKLRAVENSRYRTATTQEYEPGQDNGPVSPPVDYEIEGFLVFDVSEGRSLVLARTKRNGVKVDGTTQTSVIKKITDQGDESYLLETLNSVYLVERISER